MHPIDNTNNKDNNKYNSLNSDESVIVADATIGRDVADATIDKSSTNINNKCATFIKPSVEDIQDFINQRNSVIDAEEFYDYYESVGWKVGSKPMKDWQAAVRTWERKRKTDPKAQQQQITQETQGCAKYQSIETSDWINGRTI